MRNEITVVIKRVEKEPIGLNISGGREQEAGAIFVHSTRDEGLCSGLLLDFDVISSINGHQLGETAKRADAVQIVEGSKGDLTFVVLREPRSGILIKQGGLNKNWKKRYFVLNNRELTYYPPHQGHHKDASHGKDAPKQLPPLGTIHIDNVTSIDDYSSPSKKDFFGFQLVTPARTYYLLAETAREKKLWIDVIRPLIRHKGEDDQEPNGAISTKPDIDDDDVDSGGETDEGDDVGVAEGPPAETGAEAEAREAGAGDNEARPDHSSATTSHDQSAARLLVAGEDGTRPVMRRAPATEGTVDAPKGAPGAKGEGAFKGFLLKSSPDFKSWKRRFFVLEDAHLKYYKTIDASGKPQGTVALAPNCTVMAYEGPNAKGNPFSFCLTVDCGRQYVCSCSSTTERDQWIDKIRKEVTR